MDQLWHQVVPAISRDISDFMQNAMKLEKLNFVYKISQKKYIILKFSLSFFHKCH
jgi:hypothetical protein